MGAVSKKQTKPPKLNLVGSLQYCGVPCLLLFALLACFMPFRSDQMPVTLTFDESPPHTSTLPMNANGTVPKYNDDNSRLLSSSNASIYNDESWMKGSSDLNIIHTKHHKMKYDDPRWLRLVVVGAAHSGTTAMHASIWAQCPNEFLVSDRIGENWHWNECIISNDHKWKPGSLNKVSQWFNTLDEMKQKKKNDNDHTAIMEEEMLKWVDLMHRSHRIHTQERKHWTFYHADRPIGIVRDRVKKSMEQTQRPKQQRPPSLSKAVNGDGSIDHDYGSNNIQNVSLEENGGSNNIPKFKEIRDIHEKNRLSSLNTIMTMNTVSNLKVGNRRRLISQRKDRHLYETRISNRKSGVMINHQALKQSSTKISNQKRKEKKESKNWYYLNELTKDNFQSEYHKVLNVSRLLSNLNLNLNITNLNSNQSQIIIEKWMDQRMELFYKAKKFRTDVQCRIDTYHHRYYHMRLAKEWKLSLFEKTPSYLYNPQVPILLRHWFPHIKILIILRKPLNRLVSQMIHFRNFIIREFHIAFGKPSGAKFLESSVKSRLAKMVSDVMIKHPRLNHYNNDDPTLMNNDSILFSSVLFGDYYDVAKQLLLMNMESRPYQDRYHLRPLITCYYLPILTYLRALGLIDLKHSQRKVNVHNVIVMDDDNKSKHNKHKSSDDDSPSLIIPSDYHDTLRIMQFETLMPMMKQSKAMRLIQCWVYCKDIQCTQQCEYNSQSDTLSKWMNQRMNIPLNRICNNQTMRHIQMKNLTQDKSINQHSFNRQMFFESNLYRNARDSIHDYFAPCNAHLQALLDVFPFLKLGEWDIRQHWG